MKGIVDNHWLNFLFTNMW